MRKLPPVAFACALASLLLPRGVTAQEAGTPPAELVQLRTIYLREREAVRAAALRYHIEEIAALEETLRRRGDAAGADQVKAAVEKRRAELSQLTGSSDKGGGEGSAAAPAEIVLTPKQAKINGSLRRSQSYLLNWNSAASNASWHRRGVTPGRYDIYLDYYPMRRGGGSLELSDIHQSAKIEIPAAAATPSATSVKVATFEFKSSIGLKLTPTGRGRNGIFYLRGIRLVPVKSP